MIRRSQTHSKRGFTLLEVLIALAILAGSLTVLIGSTALSTKQGIIANTQTRISQLARVKMTDLEYELMDEGFTDDLQQFSGDFREEGFDEVRWEAEVFPVEIPPAVKDQLVGQANAQLFGGQDAQGALKGNAAFSAMLPMLVAQVPEMINQIGKKIRRVKLVLYYESAGIEETMTVTQYVVDRDSAEFNLFGTGEASSEDIAEDVTSGGDK